MSFRLALVLGGVTLTAACISLSTEEVELARVEVAEELGTELIAKALGEDAVSAWSREGWEGGLGCPTWCMTEGTTMDLGSGHPLGVLEVIAEAAVELGWSVDDPISRLPGIWHQTVSKQGIELWMSWKEGELDVNFSSDYFAVNPYIFVIDNPCDFDISLFWWTAPDDWEPYPGSFTQSPKITQLPGSDTARIESFPRGMGLALISELDWTEHYTLWSGVVEAADVPVSLCAAGPEATTQQAQQLLATTLDELSIPHKFQNRPVTMGVSHTHCPDRNTIAVRWSAWLTIPEDDPEGVATATAIGQYWEQTLGVVPTLSRRHQFTEATVQVGQVILRASGSSLGVSVDASSRCFVTAGVVGWR